MSDIYQVLFFEQICYLMISGYNEHFSVEAKLLSPLFQSTRKRKVLSVFITVFVIISLLLIIIYLLEIRNLSRCHKNILNANWLTELILIFTHFYLFLT